MVVYCVQSSCDEGVGKFIPQITRVESLCARSKSFLSSSQWASAGRNETLPPGQHIGIALGRRCVTSDTFLCSEK